MRDRQTSILRQGETAVIKPGVLHDWWNASNRDPRVQVKIIPGERFVHMIETFFGLARLGHTNRKGMPHPLQLARVPRSIATWSFFARSRGYCSVRCLPHSRQSPDAWLSRDVPPTLAHRARAADNGASARFAKSGR